MNRKLLLTFILALVSVSVILVRAARFNSAAGAAAQDYDVCLTDDDGSAASLRFNSRSGDYIFCAGGGRNFTGQGTITKVGRVVAIQHQTGDRRLVASVNLSAKTGSGSIQSPIGTTVASISDRNTADSNCQCR
jgi:hypothetical protein